MSEQNDETQTVAEPEPRPGWRDRVYGVRGVAAVAVAGLIIGGGAGAAIHAATVDDGGPFERAGFGRGGGPGGFPGFPGGQMPGQGGGPGQGQLPQPPNGLPAPPDGAPARPGVTGTR